MMIFMGRYFLPLLVISSNTKVVLINICLLKKKSMTLFLNSNKHGDEPVNRLPSMANVIASEPLFPKQDFSMIFCSRDGYKSRICYKKTSLTNIVQNLKNSSLITNLIYMTVYNLHLKWFFKLKSNGYKFHLRGFYLSKIKYYDPI